MQSLRLACLSLLLAIGCGSTAEPPASPSSTVVDNSAPAPRDACTRAYACCRAFWDAHDVLTADLTPEDTDCHETRGVTDDACERAIDRYTRDLSGIDAAKRAAVENACRA
jgi:hypothetical protein